MRKTTVATTRPLPPPLSLSRPLFLCLRHSVTGESDAHNYNYKRGVSPTHERRERTGDYAVGERGRLKRLKRGMESETEAQWKKKEDEEDQ